MGYCFHQRLAGAPAWRAATCARATAKLVVGNVQCLPQCSDRKSCMEENLSQKPFSFDLLGWCDRTMHEFFE
jgi:hypothetical protein